MQLNDLRDGDVSIHAPREGCDKSVRMRSLSMLSFNSRTPGGVRLRMFDRGLPVDTFQFTHPGRGATFVISTIVGVFQFQFTHPGRGATKESPFLSLERLVSIHAPREGCDALGIKFYSRSEVSIHAPREGCDKTPMD